VTATPTPPKHHHSHHRAIARHPRAVHRAPALRVGLAGSAASLGTTAAGASATETTSHASSHASGSGVAHPGVSHHHRTSGGSFTSNFFSAPVIRLVKFIPGAVWLALGVSTALALLGLGAALFFRRRAVRQAGRMAEVETAALTDPLTGVLNRRGFAQAVERELARSRRYGRPFVLAYADVRGLKSVNDSEGHLAGDQLLRAVASVLGESARAHDLVGRLGGDEFALLLPEQSGQNVGSVIERIGEHLHEARDELGFHSYWGLTIGAASFPADGETFDELLAIADRRLYEKRGIELLAGA
jgi:diguanylate cyclase (GGDEF)-like protein